MALIVLPVSAARASDRDDGSIPAPPNIVQRVTNVPARTLNAVGTGRLSGRTVFVVSTLHRALTRAGKPELVSMNLAWCPHCAANSWALAVALSRFGTLTGLRVINSGTYYCTLVHDPCNLAAGPCYPNTHGLSFIDSRYQSRYLTFAPIVLQDVHGHNLERIPRREGSALKAFDPQGQTPEVDVGGAFGFVNSGFSPGALAGLSWTQIANRLADPHAAVAQHVDGVANVLTAAICRVTQDRPRAVCTSPGVIAAGRARLG
ncbi:MAG: DUF929 family protein [Solirubrobacteraceae bacterium]